MTITALSRKHIGLCVFAALISTTATLAHAGKVTYCCTTAQGRNACGDILPQECYGRAYRELNERGSLLRQVDAPLTAEQRTQRDAEEKLKKQAEAAALEQQRLDKILLNTYANEKEIDLVRDRTLDQIGGSVKSLQTKYDETLKRRKQLSDEQAGYKGKAVPNTLKERIRTNELDLQTQLAATEEKKREMELVVKRYDEEKRRYVELKQGSKNAVARMR